MFRTKCKEHDHSSFYRFLQMEHSHKNTDCYFFYYSTCKKGDHCPFRHEPSALGCETMCSYWQQGNCLNEHCSFRHMELKKNRKSIPCYWETQPSGCRKPHCPFLHKNARTICDPINPVKTTDITSKPFNQEWLNRQDDTKYDTSSAESDQGRGSSEAGSFIGSPAVDPLIVKFEEESDNESVPSPIKTQPQPRVPYCKTYEEIRLEEIQAESAAYYSYEAQDRAGEQPGKDLSKMTTPTTTTTTTTATTTTTKAKDGKQDTTIGKIRRVVAVRETRKVRAYPKIGTADKKRDETAQPEKKSEITNELNFQVLTLEEIRRRKRRKALLQDTGEIEDIELESPKTADKISEEWTPASDLSKDSKKLTVLRATNMVITPRGSKRSLEEDKETGESTDDRRVKAKITEEARECVAKVPPVRLRRSPKRFPAHDREPATRQQTLSKSFEKSRDLSLEESRDEDNDLENDEIENEDDRKSPIERLDQNLDVRVNRDSHDDSNIATRKNEVEVRLCDSSTDEERMRMDEATTMEERERNDTKSILMDTVIEDSKASRLSCDSLLAINEDEYLMLDTASDDILKDIDALLKDKPVV